MSIDNALLAAHAFINLFVLAGVCSLGRQKRAGFGVGGGPIWSFAISEE